MTAEGSGPDAAAAPGGTAPAARLGWLPILGICALFVALFWPIIDGRILYYTEQPRYSHCLLLPLVSALWVWERWEALRAIPRTPSRVGLCVLGVSVAAFLLGRAVNMNLLQHAALLGALAGSVHGLMGRRVLVAAAFPLGYLALTVPLPKVWDDAITLPLQRIATIVAEGSFDALGWVVVRQGNVIQLPGLKLLVEDQCSGVHSLYALVALGVAWIFFMDRPVWLRVLLAAATVPIAVVANTIRVIGTGILAYKVDPSYAVGVRHETAGMIVFGIGLALFLLTDWCLKPDPEDEGDVAA